MKIEVGKYYKNRGGYVVGPIESNHDDPSYPFGAIVNGAFRSYSVDGEYYIGDEDDFDLVEECNADGSPIVQEDHLGTPSWATTFDKIQRQEIALAMLPTLVADFLKDVRAGFMQADVGESGPQWSVVAKESFAIADEFIKVAKQS